MILTTFASCALVALGVVNGQSLRNITVDDTDPAITYKGSWKRATGETDSYGGGRQSSSEAGASATFTFTGVAVYYFMPLLNDTGVSTLLTLDSGPAQLVNLTRVGSESTRSAVRWSATGLTNGRHTLVSSPGRTSSGEVAGWGQVDGFIYTANDSGNRTTTISCDDPRIIYAPRGVWTTNATDLPSCAITKSGVRVTSTANAFLTFDFAGETVFIRTINSPRGGNLSLSVNGGPEQIYDTYAKSTVCGSTPSQRVLAVKVRRSGLLRSRSYSNTLTVKNVNGETQIDGITDGQYRPNAAHRTVFMDGTFCAGTTFFISYLLYSGIL